MSYVSEEVKEFFAERYTKCMSYIKQSGIKYEHVGIFGSYARGEYTARSDIDFCIIVNEMPERYLMGGLREDLDMLDADVVFVTQDYFDNDMSRFAVNLRRDFKTVNL